MRAFAALAFALVLTAAARADECAGPGPDFPRFYTDAALFERALAKADNVTPSPRRLSGLIAPHHLLADHLVARGFKFASAGEYRRIVILFPDHFRGSQKPFATSTRGFDTLFGRVATDVAAAEKLLAAGNLARPSCLFAKDHGLQAMLPFVVRHFPGVPIIPVAVSIKSTRSDWDAMADLLAGIVDAETLVLESTDFSHYLPHHEARRRDQQTLNILAARDFDALAKLVQPDHVDSLGALYVQMKLQDAVHGARPLVLANENAQQYVDKPAAETTSYVVAAFIPATGATPAPDFPGTTTRYFAGDTFFGRAMTGLIAGERPGEMVEAAVRAMTLGRPLIVNLEGVILPDVPAGIDHLTLAMPEGVGPAVAEAPERDRRRHGQ
ncbi:MAG: AmmeMemoRadiSam system protein B [Phyllobacteriaceae bacterium]|nr:AmmeMemoRadiSam system protein B [Phyllobacteriaceae bacterium]